MADFQVGDTVELKSGSPTMVIDRFGKQGGEMQGTAYCSWFDAKSQPQHAWFPLTSLKKVA